MTHQADEIRRMAHWHELAAIGHDRGGAPIDAKKHRDTVDMLREYAEGVERIDAAEHLILWNVDNFQDLPLSDNYYEKWLGEARIYIRTHINPPSPLTAALSGREGEK